MTQITRRGVPVWNYWNEIAQGVVLARSSGIGTAAHLFAGLNLAFADAVIAFWGQRLGWDVARFVVTARAGSRTVRSAA